MIKSAAVSAVMTVFVFMGNPAFSQSHDLARFETAKKYFKSGLEYFNRMQYLAACEYFRKAVKELPDYYTARDYLARSYKLAGYYDSALKEWESVHEASPMSVAIASKIDSLRFKQSSPETGFTDRNLVIFTTYKSSSYKKEGFPYPVDMALDGEKNLYITSFTTGRIVKVDANGRISDVFQPSLSSKLYGIDCFGGRLAVSDFSGDSVHILSVSGKKILKFGGSGGNDGQIHGPEGISFDRKGMIYVVDSGNNRVQKFNQEGEFILKFGEKGEYEGQLNGPTDVAVANGKIYVTDTGNRRIACFDDYGNFIGNLAPEGLDSPRGISMMDGRLLVSDEKKGLLIFDPGTGESKWINSWEKDKKGFTRLVSSVADRDGYLYCLDYNNQCVHLFSPARKRYSNLDIEITSVDTAKFPVVAIYANIRNRDGTPLYGLDANNIKITEDGARIGNIYIDYLKKSLPSVSFALCIDRSEAGREYHNELAWLSDFILKKMKKNDSLKVVNFNGDYWEGNRFDWSRRRALKAIKATDYGRGKNTGTALYNSLGDLSVRLNRRGLVLVTDGTLDEDSFRNYDPATIINYARSHYIPIYVVSFKKPNEILSRIARETGGEAIRASDVDSLRGIYDRIKKTDEYRYVMVYSTFKLRSFRGWWSEIKLEVNQKGQKGVEWGGYFVP